jgi:DNA polymerase
MTKQSDIDKIKFSVEKCQKCDLHKSRTNCVFGEGSLDTKILIIGEAPGYNEDIKGKPFVGKAGKILENILESLGFKKTDVYITNILKCRPPKNRNPTKIEVEKCTDYLNKQIEIIKPKIILPLGNFASSYILQKFGLEFNKISDIHGKTFIVQTLFGNIYIIPQYHPAVATYNPNKIKILQNDLKQIKKLIIKT